MAMAKQQRPAEEDWRLFKECGNEDARGRLAERYLPLVRYVIDRIAYKLPAFIERDDLISEGILGLIDALDKFDMSRLNKFETYAIVRIRGAVLDSLRQMDWVPRTLRQKSRDIETAFNEVERELGRPATDEEVSQKLGISTDELNETLGDIAGSVVFSFEELLQMSDDDKPLPFIARVKNETAADPSDTTVKKEVKKILTKAVEKLPENEKIVVGLYYVESMTLKQIGEAMGVTESRVCQIHTKAMLRMKSALMERDREIFFD
ncbi:MAG TPA: FliA/WhiG family RNA polymerase sigma factor [bacterium]|nr:MAG: RNA polymerase sigma factor FliA [bacterium ADurb.Bin236]HPI75284.1 FliA/WhiG family RNA polymerase sigma factor [bacterium]HPN94580.1 FliA/WhiG family RNA polymerase sigma factor [bacterium]